MREPVRQHAPVNGAKAYAAARSSGHRLHAGVDLAAPRGTTVEAPEKSQVVLAVDDADTAPPVNGWAWRGYGPALVVLRGVSGAYHLLAHLGPQLRVAEGDIVDEGVPVGEVAQNHVHWEVRSSLVPPRGAAVIETTTDPALWLQGSPRLYDADVDGCPQNPTNDFHTPWTCRPSSRGGAPFALVDFGGAATLPVARVTTANAARAQRPVSQNARSGMGWFLLGVAAFAALPSLTRGGLLGGGTRRRGARRKKRT